MAEMMAMRDPLAYLKPEHIKKMIEEEPNFRNKLIIRLLFHGGMRVSELCNALITDVLWEENCILIPWLKRKTPPGKPHFKRQIPLDSKTMQMLKDWLEMRRKEKIRLKDKTIIALDRRMVYWIVRKAGERIGLTQVGDRNNPHHVHPHTMRHSYCVHRVKQTGGDYEKLRRVQLDVGHANINTTAGYLSVSAEELHQEYDKAFEGMD